MFRAILAIILSYSTAANGAQILFGRTQRAVDTPFDNTTNGFLSTNVQDAMTEVQAIIRYAIQASYGGNANAGTYLEIFPGEDSNAAPLYIPDAASIVAVAIQANSNSTGAIRIYNKTTATTLYDAAFSGTSKIAYTNLSVTGIHDNDEISFLVVNAAVTKPKIRVWFNVNPG